MLRDCRSVYKKNNQIFENRWKRLYCTSYNQIALLLIYNCDNSLTISRHSPHDSVAGFQYSLFKPLILPQTKPTQTHFVAHAFVEIVLSTRSFSIKLVDHASRTRTATTAPITIASIVAQVQHFSIRFDE